MLVPSPGSKLFVGTYTSGMAFESVNEKPIEQRIVDGNYVVASEHPRPWIKQLNLLAAYFYFFNPLRMFVALLRPKSAIPHVADETSPPRKSTKCRAAGVDGDVFDTVPSHISPTLRCSWSE